MANTRGRACEECRRFKNEMQQAKAAGDWSRQTDLQVLRNRHQESCTETVGVAA